jgi:hypothetical protein
VHELLEPTTYTSAMTAIGPGSRRIVWSVCIVGAATLAMTLLLAALFPRAMGPLPEGMRTPVVAFELARSAEEVERMFGPRDSAERASWAAAMDRGNVVDFAFMVLYGAYLALFAQTLRQLGARSRWLVLLAPVPALMDALENLELLRITSMLGHDFAAPLARLAWFTWSKWLLLALNMALWMRPLWRLGLLGRAAALSAGLTALMTAAALFVRGRAAELMGLGCALTMLLTWFVALQLLRRGAIGTTGATP